MRKLVAALAAVTVAAGAAFATTLAGPDTPKAQAASRKTVTVKIANYDFSKHKVTIRRGQRVRWVWADGVSHDVRVVSGPRKFRSKIKNRGSYPKTFTKSGTYRIDCSIHPSVMKMTVVVKR